MSLRSPWIIYGAILLLVAVVSVAVYYHTAWEAQSGPVETTILPGTEQEDAGSVSTPRGVRVEGGEVEQRDEQGSLMWRVRASGDLMYDDRDRLLRGTDVEFDVLAQDQPAVSLRAPRLLARDDGKRIEFAEGISGTSQDHNSAFEVQQMEYLAEIQKLVGTGGVVLRQGDYLISADQLVIDVKNRQTRLRGNVSVARRR
jgi:hypothetical protein